MNLPSNPILLMSILNTYLQDKYSSLDELCDDLDVSKSTIIDNLLAAGYIYISELNQFKAK